MTFDYDLFVIGGGSGGVRAARVAAATGAKVALADGVSMADGGSMADGVSMAEGVSMADDGPSTAPVLSAVSAVMSISTSLDPALFDTVITSLGDSTSLG